MGHLQGLVERLDTSAHAKAVKPTSQSIDRPRNYCLEDLAAADGRTQPKKFPHPADLSLATPKRPKSAATTKTFAGRYLFPHVPRKVASTIGLRALTKSDGGKSGPQHGTQPPAHVVKPVSKSKPLIPQADRYATDVANWNIMQHHSPLSQSPLDVPRPLKCTKESRDGQRDR